MPFKLDEDAMANIGDFFIESNRKERLNSYPFIRDDIEKLSTTNGYILFTLHL